MIFLFLFLALFFSCTKDTKEVVDVYARVGETTLTKKEVLEMKKEGLVEQHSIRHLVDSWVEKTLFYNEAINIDLDNDKTLLNKRDLFYKNLLISSFLEIKTKKEIKISRKEVSAYYKKNKDSFIRKQNEILLKHFTLPTKKEANKLKSLLKSNKKGDQLEKYIEKYKPETKTIKEGFINKNLIGFIFDGSVGDILGPKKIESSYHVFDILKKNNKGTIKGLEIVYDEIHQRLFKIKEMQLLNKFLDSLYTSADIYISPEVSK
tara:strand:- start:452 stop:1240 length:789 start_codon:yes stop_codon:yes gene_type:complete